MSRINFHKAVEKKQEDLSRYISGYSIPEKPQSIDEIRGDFQLAGLMTTINSYASKYSKISILDVGCGNGTLLAKLGDSNFFTDNSEVHYIGFDFKDKLKDAFSTSLELNCQSISTFIQLDKDNWTNNLKENSIVIIRNVLHELKIKEASKLIYEICEYLPYESVVFIQDMTTLPTAEKGNAGWLGVHIKSILEKGGLDVTFTPDTSKRGIDVFLIEATRKTRCKLSQQDINKLVRESRQKQLELLSDECKKTETSPDNSLQIARLHHDITSISLDLNNHKCIEDDTTAAYTFSLAFKSISEIDIENIIVQYEYPRIKGFQNRGTQIDSIDEFLRSDKSIYVLQSGRYLGKKTLVWWALDQKISHQRLPIYLTLNESTNIFTILEEIASQIGVVNNLDVEILMSLKNLPSKNIKNTEDIKSSLSFLIKKSILILDGFENCVDPNDEIQNEDVSWLIDFWSNKIGSKIIIQTRSKVKDIPFSKSRMEFMSTFPKSKNEKYKYTRQLLDEIIPISYRSETVGFESYPEELLTALDNHPYFIYVAGTLIRNNPDTLCLTNKEYISILKNRLYDVLISDFDLNEKERLSIYSLSLIKVPVPNEFINILCGEEITNKLLNKGFLVQEIPGKFRLLGILNNIKIGKNKEEVDKLEFQLHKKIASIFYNLYENKSDPTFLRQAHHHNLLTGDKNLSPYFLPQLSQVAEEWFSKREYTECIWAYKTINEVRKLYPRERLRFASCLIRVQNIEEGKEEYEELISQFKSWKGVKSSYVDSLLFVGGHAKLALQILKKIPHKEGDFYWHRQKARCYVQLKKRLKAYENYEIAILNSGNHNSWNIIRELTSYAHKVGDDKVEHEWLNYAWNFLKLHIDEIRIELGAYYERMGDLYEAEDFLLEAYENSPNNAYCVLPLIKTLCELDKMEKVEEIMKYSSKATPKEVMNYARIFVLKKNKEFNQCRQLIEKSLLNTNNDLKIHRWGQWADLFYSWCQELKGDEKVETAKEGLKYINEIINERNVPAMMACRELALVIEDESLINKIEKNILYINDSFDFN